MKWFLSIKLFFLISCFQLLLFKPCFATEKFFLTLENHVFTPSELIIPKNKKVKLIVENKDPIAEEFDSFDLNREKVIFPHQKAVIFVGPLEPGEYEYFGEFHPNSARGKIIVKEVENAH